MPHILETNCPITFVTDINPLQREIIAAILNNAASLKEDLYIISNVITEFGYVDAPRQRVPHDFGNFRRNPNNGCPPAVSFKEFS